MRPTPAAQTALEQATLHLGHGSRHTSIAPGGLSDKQEEILRYLLRQTGPVPLDHVDRKLVSPRLAIRESVVLKHPGYCPSAYNLTALSTKAGVAESTCGSG